MTNPGINCSSSAITDREIIERNRRNNEMKELLSTLNSLVSNVQTSEELAETVDLLENATDYIKKLEEKVDKLKEKKEKLKLGMRKCSKKIMKPTSSSSSSSSWLNVEARQVDSLMEFILTIGFDDHFVLPQILKLLHENGAEVVNVYQFRLSDRFFHKIIAQVVGEGMAPGGSDFERIRETVNKFVSQYKDGQYNV